MCYPAVLFPYCKVLIRGFSYTTGNKTYCSSACSESVHLAWEPDEFVELKMLFVLADD